ncbi:substrate-binding periplasmic protein [Paludibacterium purpuratum]|uniref:Amino acid ABC transporter substrate-binding protein (PAAT family) n=1 Tax=Paludibacterium purpuratum TaxID=1144873 RepID=A0A4R7BDS3_9NEIS|nr:transporter substrate-binding domain-containing protein [Paludibacterium purpuratum]TDR82903.1 amino acid ABC transporter substrate-binding protein (PAAT family) [Paludibacterium purpuratum]
MRWIRLIALPFMLLAGPLCLAQQSELSITLSNDEYPPYVGEKLPGYGLLSRIVTEAFKLQQVNVRYVFYPNNRTLQSARTGAADGSLGWAKTPERERDLLYTDPVMNLSMVFFQRKKHPVPWKRLQDLAGARIGITSGNTYSEDFSRLQQAKVLTVEAAPDDVSNLRKLQAGHLDLFPIDSEVGSMLLVQSLPLAQRTQIEAQETPFWSAPMHVVIWKGHPQAAELVRRFNLGLRQLRRSGEFDRVVETTREQIYQHMGQN